MIISGQYVKTEHRKGEFTPDDAAPGTDPIAYDFHLVHVFDGESIVEVRLPEGIAASDLPYKLRDQSRVLRRRSPQREVPGQRGRSHAQPQRRLQGSARRFLIQGRVPGR